MRLTQRGRRARLSGQGELRTEIPIDVAKKQSRALFKENKMIRRVHWVLAAVVLLAPAALAQAPPPSKGTPHGSATATNRTECERLKRHLLDQRHGFRERQERELQECRRTHPTGNQCEELSERQRKALEELKERQGHEFKNCKGELKEEAKEEKKERREEEKEEHKPGKGSKHPKKQGL